MAALVPTKSAEILAGLRAGTRPRDLLGRVQLLLLALALLSAAGVFVCVVASHSSPTVLWLLGLAAPPALALVWLSAYRTRSMGAVADAVTVGAICIITMAVANRWDGYICVVLAAAVMFASGYGSLPHVLVRTALLAAIELGQGVSSSDSAALTTAIVFAIGFVIVAALMSGMVNSIARYEATARREQILAATGLDLVAADDLAEIAAAAVESGMALCGEQHGIRVSLAIAEDRECRPIRFKVIGSRGCEAEALLGQSFDENQVVVPGREAADHVLLTCTAGRDGRPGPGSGHRVAVRARRSPAGPGQRGGRDARPSHRRVAGADRRGAAHRPARPGDAGFARDLARSTSSTTPSSARARSGSRP